MRDIYTEAVVPASEKPIYKAAKFLLMGLTGISVFGFFALGTVFLIAGAIFGVLLYLVMQKSGGEYEYIHTNNCFDVDLVISNSRRKQLFTIDLEKVLLVAPVDSEAMEEYDRLPETDYSGDGGKENLYAMVCTDSGKRRKILLRLNPKMHRSLKLWMPEKVK